MNHFVVVMYPVNTKHLYNVCAMLDQRRRRWADVVQMLYKYFVLAGFALREQVSYRLRMVITVLLVFVE